MFLHPDVKIIKEPKRVYPLSTPSEEVRPPKPSPRYCIKVSTHRGGRITAAWTSHDGGTREQCIDAIDRLHTTCEKVGFTVLSFSPYHIHYTGSDGVVNKYTVCECDIDTDTQQPVTYSVIHETTFPNGETSESLTLSDVPFDVCTTCILANSESDASRELISLAPDATEVSWRDLKGTHHAYIV